MIAILENIKEKYLLVILEDFLLVEKVDTASIENHFKFMENNSINHMHPLNDSIPYDFEHGETYGIYAQGAPYRANVYGFWDRDCLLRLLQPGENPWNFEIMGSYRSFSYPNFLAIKKNPLRTINLIEKGSYIPSSEAYCLKNGIALSYEKRVSIRGSKKIKYVIQKIIFKGTNLISWRTRLSLMNKFRKILSCY